MINFIPMAEIPVASDVPIPHMLYAPRHNYPFAKCKIGDSFVVPRIKRSSVTTLVIRYNARFGANLKFTSRLQPDGTVRIWRIA